MLGILKFEKLGNTKQQHLKKKKKPLGFRSASPKKKGPKSFVSF